MWKSLLPGDALIDSSSLQNVMLVLELTHVDARLGREFKITLLNLGAGGRAHSNEFFSYAEVPRCFTVLRGTETLKKEGE